MLIEANETFAEHSSSVSGGVGGGLDGGKGLFVHHFSKEERNMHQAFILKLTD